MDQRGEELGTVEATWEFPGHHVLVVRRGRREVLIPAAKSFVTEVDLAQRRMVVQVIEGLIEDRDAL
jgi:ribosomal 30S subunit maturation factor RimM